MFGMEPANSVERAWSIDVDLEEHPWTIGLVVGPSGSGKTTVLEDLFDYGGKHKWADWPAYSALIDGFADELDTDEIVRTLTGVGFSSPPAWLRPYGTLSTGEQFRADLARVLLHARLRAAWGLDNAVAVVDEFTSTVDRTVAATASAAVARLLRECVNQPNNISAEVTPRLVAASCHYDIIDWLQPDWLLDMSTGTFTWRHLQPRPPIHLDVRRADHAEWAPFAAHHYLSAKLDRHAHGYLASVDGRPAVFTAVLPTPSPKRYMVARESRTVCVPDFQGVGMGHAVADTVAAAYQAAGWRYRSTTSHPAMIGRRARSPLWDMVRSPGFVDARPVRVGDSGASMGSSASRRTATFEFVGPPNAEAAELLEVPAFTKKN